MHNRSFLIFEAYYATAGGNQRYIRMLFDAPPGGWRPILLCPGEGWLAEQVRRAGGAVHCLPQPRRLNRYDGAILAAGPIGWLLILFAVLRYNLRALPLLRRLDPAAIQCHNVRSLLMVGLAARILGIPTLLYIKAELGNPLIDRIGFRLAARVPFIADALKPAIHARLFRAAPEKFPRLPIGIDLDAAATAARRGRDAPPAGTGIGSDGVDFAFAGWLVPAKGVAVLIEAFAELLKTHPRCRLHVLGDSADADHVVRLRQLAHDRGAAAAVRFHGWRDDVLDVLAAADVFVLPSMTEGVPRSIVEAMALGVPVIATRVGGVPELLGDGDYGLLVAPGDPGELTRAMAALADDAARRTALAGRAREMAVGRYDFAAHGGALARILDGLVAPPRTVPDTPARRHAA